MFYELSHLFFSEIVFIWRVPLKGKWIVWILRMLFVINITWSIFPIRKTCLVRTSLLGRCIILLNLSLFLLLRDNLEWLKCNSICSWEFHFMWIDDFMFFFWIKSFSLRKNLNLLALVMIFLLIISVHSLRIWIFYKSIWTSGFSSNRLTSHWIYNITTN